MGFQDLPEIVHWAVSRKGGRVKKSKGVAKLSPERRREIAAMGGNAKRENRSRLQEIKEARDTSLDELHGVADTPGDVSE